MSGGAAMSITEITLINDRLAECVKGFLLLG